MEYVSKTLLRDARKSMVSAMKQGGDVATIARTGIQVPVLVVVDRREIRHRQMPENLKVRRWKLLMPDPTNAIWNGTTVNSGDRATVPGHGVFMVLERTDPNTFNISTTVYGILTNAKVSFYRDEAGPDCHVDNVDVYISRVTDVEGKTQLDVVWEVWYDASVRYPDLSPTKGGLLISKGDKINWSSRLPNPPASKGIMVLDKPRSAYAEGQLTAALLREA